MTLETLNKLDASTLGETLRSCCGSNSWVEKMLAAFPVKDKDTLLDAAAAVWYSCTEKDWREAFAQHPKIGEKTANARAAAEQSGTRSASGEVLTALAAGNRAYEAKFGYIFIVCATGRSAEEMLGLLQERIGNDPEKEVLIARGEQGKITRIRLEKLLT